MHTQTQHQHPGPNINILVSNIITSITSTSTWPFSQPFLMKRRARHQAHLKSSREMRAHSYIGASWPQECSSSCHLQTGCVCMRRPNIHIHTALLQSFVIEKRVRRQAINKPSREMVGVGSLGPGPLLMARTRIGA